MISFIAEINEKIALAHLRGFFAPGSETENKESALLLF